MSTLLLLLMQVLFIENAEVIQELMLTAAEPSACKSLIQDKICNSSCGAHFSNMLCFVCVRADLSRVRALLLFR